MGWGNRSQKQMDPNDPAALLDQLMGSTRNMTETEKATARPAWEEKDVCQMYLAGCCPNALFHASQKRSDLAPCVKVHSEPIRADYQKENPSEPGTKRRELERRLLRELRILVKSMDDKVRATKERVELEQKAAAAAKAADKAPPNEVTAKALAEFTEQISELVRKAEEAGDEGDVETAERSLAEAEEKKKLKLELEATAAKQAEENLALAKVKVTGTMFGEQHVCEVCCSITSVRDELNNQNHLGGQMHAGWTEIRAQRERLEELLKDEPELAREQNPNDEEEGEITAPREGRDRDTATRGPSGRVLWGGGGGGWDRELNREPRRGTRGGRHRGRDRSRSGTDTTTGTGQYRRTAAIGTALRPGDFRLARQFVVLRVVYSKSD